VTNESLAQSYLKKAGDRLDGSCCSRRGHTPVSCAKPRNWITGQDGSCLAELLLSKGYEVYGIIRRSSSFNTARIESVYQDPQEKGLSAHLLGWRQAACGT